MTIWETFLGGFIVGVTFIVLGFLFKRLSSPSKTSNDQSNPVVITRTPEEILHFKKKKRVVSIILVALILILIISTILKS